MIVEFVSCAHVNSHSGYVWSWTEEIGFYKLLKTLRQLKNLDDLHCEINGDYISLIINVDGYHMIKSWDSFKFYQLRKLRQLNFKNSFIKVV